MRQHPDAAGRLHLLLDSGGLEGHRRGGERDRSLTTGLQLGVELGRELLDEGRGAGGELVEFGLRRRRARGVGHADREGDLDATLLERAAATGSGDGGDNQLLGGEEVQRGPEGLRERGAVLHGPGRRDGGERELGGNLDGLGGLGLLRSGSLLLDGGGACDLWGERE